MGLSADFEREIKIFITRLLSDKLLCLSLQPNLDKNQRDKNKAVKVIKNKVKCLQFNNYLEKEE
jgi:hypothetical protein